MALVAQIPALTRTGPAPSGYDQKLSTRSRKHKVVLESVTQEKKKLRSVLSFKAEPPKGYTFIPAGNPELTNALKEFARKGNYEIYAVSTTPHQRAHDLSQQVHRIGFHFPSAVVAQVCAHYGIVLTSAGTVLAEGESQSFHRHSKRLKELPTAQERKDQITINTEARDTIRDLFPNIPDNDLNQIIKTAFQKGQGKVGTANELSLIRRGQLAVVAHIRHVYTDYDKLLRQTHYRDARNLVEKPTLRRLVQWRGDDENGKQVLEDVFREVVVISDDDDSGDEYDDDEAVNHFRDISVEIVSSNTKADHFNPESPELRDTIGRRPEATHPIDSKERFEFEYIAAPPQKERTNRKDKASRRGFSRYQAWNEAREEYRANPTDTADIDDRGLAFSAPEVSFQRPYTGPGGSAHRAETSDHAYRKSYQYQDTSVRSPNDTPDTFRAQDGTLYERVVKFPSTGSQQPLTRPLTYKTRSAAAAGKVRSIAVAESLYPQNRGQSLDFQGDTILPSIEGPEVAVAPSHNRAVSANHRSLPSVVNEPREIVTKKDVERMGGIEFLDLTDETQIRNKRRRVDAKGSEISQTYRKDIVAPSLPLQQREPEYISLLSPTDHHVQPSNFNDLPPSRHQHPHDHSQISSFVPTYRDSQGYTSPTSIIRAGERSVARRATGQLSNLTHFRSHEALYPSASSPRMHNESSPPRVQSTLPRVTTPTDRGIQEYRAFRARERHERALHSPSARGRPRRFESSSFIDGTVKSPNGQLQQYDGAGSSHDLSHRLPPRKFVQGFSAVDDSVPVLRERVAGREHPPRRRSASPVQDSRNHLTYVPALSQRYVQRQQEVPQEYGLMDSDRVSLRREGFEPVLVRPTPRFEQEAYTAPEYMPMDHEDGEPRSANLRRSYARL